MLFLFGCFSFLLVGQVEFGSSGLFWRFYVQLGQWVLCSQLGCRPLFLSLGAARCLLLFQVPLVVGGQLVQFMAVPRCWVGPRDGG
jgi:hypothetical protein